MSMHLFGQAARIVQAFGADRSRQRRSPAHRGTVITYLNLGSRLSYAE